MTKRAVVKQDPIAGFPERISVEAPGLADKLDALADEHATMYPPATVALQELKIGDRIRLVGNMPCTVVAIEPVEKTDSRRILTVRLPGRRTTSIWLWRYSRIERLT